MKRLTKIVATIGPATESVEIIQQLIEAGMNVARFNTKHGTPEWHKERIERVREVAVKLHQPVAVLLDLQGPEIRIRVPSGSFVLKTGDEAVLSISPLAGVVNNMCVPAEVIKALQKGNTILLEDGVCELEIIEKSADTLKAKAVSDCEVKDHKSMNTPGIVIDMPSLVESDLVQLDGAAPLGIDYVGLSYVRGKADIEHLRRELDKRQIKAGIVAKIENQTALDNIDEIIDASDVVMVARGDLAVEVPFEQLAFWQKLIIAKCRLKAKPVITATQMLKSMVESPRPTRAEVTDVANAVYDSTSAVMLSEETTIGKYPVKAVETQDKITAFNEPYVESYLDECDDQDSSSCITHAAMSLAQHEGAGVDSIICLTETGATAGLMSRFRPKKVVHALTSNEQTYRKLSLHFGVIPHIVDFPAGGVQEPEAIAKMLVKLGIVEKNKTVLIIYGSIWKTPGLTNSLSLVKTPAN